MTTFLLLHPKLGYQAEFYSPLNSEGMLWKDCISSWPLWNQSIHCGLKRSPFARVNPGQREAGEQKESGICLTLFLLPFHRFLWKAASCDVAMDKSLYAREHFSQVLSGFPLLFTVKNRNIPVQLHTDPQSSACEVTCNLVSCLSFLAWVWFFFMYIG